MGHREYADPLVNEITYISQIIITIIAYILNILLIFIIRRSSRRDIGTYRILLTYFAVSDLYYNTLHFIVYPIPEMYGNAFMMRGHGFYTDLLGLSLYLGAYGHAFPILIFHFLYRLLAVKHPKFLDQFPLFFVALVVSTAASNALMFVIFYWLFGPDEESLRLLAPIFNGSIPQTLIHTADNAEKFAQALYWTGDTFEGPRWRNLAGVGLMCMTMVCAYVTIVCCSVFINKYLKKQMKSALSMRLHKQLFRSLIYQSFVPLFTAYYPAGTSIVLPVFGITIPYISIIVPPACATHPLFDPLLLILTITEYRRAFFAMSGISRLSRAIKSTPPKETSVSMFTRASIITVSNCGRH